MDWHLMSFADSLPGPERKILAVSSTTTDFILDTLASHQSSSVLEWARVYTTAAAASQPASQLRSFWAISSGAAGTANGRNGS
jgi:hypothetical protein